MPDVIITHPGWGGGVSKIVWPKAKLGIYCEFYYHASEWTSGLIRNLREMILIILQSPVKKREHFVASTAN